MFEINRENFGQFIAMLRKEKGMTQKELAQQLFISDKAVSKWETGKSIPDITLLVPLSELLEVSVTELLECRRIAQTENIGMEQADTIVKKVIGLTEDEQSMFQRVRKRKKQIRIYFVCVCLAIIELFCCYKWRNAIYAPVEHLYVVWILTIGFGCYFWIFIKEKLPSYYDENEINIYVDGILHMNFPGVYYNNQNWPYIVKALRIWSGVGMVVFPLFYILVIVVFGQSILLLELFLILGFVLGGMFLPVVIVGRKYRYKTGEEAKKRESLGQTRKRASISIFVIVVILLIAILYFLQGGISIFSGSRIAYIDKKTRTMWSAEYQYLNGYTQRTLLIPKDKEKVIIQTETKDGVLSIEIKDKNGTVIFEKESLEDSCYEVEATDKIVVRITADKHKGSFQIGE